MASIQAKGKEIVLEMYGNREAEAWSIFQGKQFLFKGIGEDSLNDTLEMLIRASSNSMYRLNIYEDISDVKQIKEKTPSDGSFNFVLNVSNGYAAENDNKGERHTVNSITKKIEDRIAQKLGIILDAEDEPQEPQTIGDILQQPDAIKSYLEVFGMIKNLFAPAGATPMQLSAVGNATRTDEQVVSKEYTAEEQMRLIAAINTLQENDPEILQHLEKLAKLSKDDPDKFKNLLSMLSLL